MTHSDQMTLIHTINAYRAMMAQLRSVQAYNFHLFVEHERREEYHRRQEMEYLIKAKRYGDYAMDMTTRLDRMKTHIQQQYQIDITQYLPYRSCNNEA